MNKKTKRILLFLVVCFSILLLTSCGNEKTYVVTFDSVGGTEVSQQNVKSGELLNEPSIPFKEGYNFIEWQLNDKKFDFNTTVTKDMRLVAKWTKNQYVVTFDSNGGSVVANQRVNHNELIVQPDTPTKERYNFVEWQLNGQKYDFNQPVTENITLVAKWEKGEYQPKWELNTKTNGWNGQNMTIKIMVDSVASYDPFDDNYIDSDKKLKQSHERKVEAAYNINIVYEEFTSNWGIDRITDIKNNVGANWEYSDTINEKTGLAEGGVYIININSTWIYELANANFILELYNIENKNGLFKDVFMENIEEVNFQNEMNNILTKYQTGVYGYNPNPVEPNYFMYYNADMIAEKGLEDPAELWFKGKWTWGKFEEYVTVLQNSLNVEQKVLAIGYTDFLIGSSAALGNPLATTTTELNLSSNATLNTLNKIKSLYDKEVFSETDGDVVTSFLLEKSVFVNASLGYWNNINNFDSVQSIFTIGAVPYPTADNNGGTPAITTDSTSKDIIYGYNGEPLKDENNNYIAGIDLSNSTFKLPYTSTNCYSITNFSNSKNGITPTIVSAILYDLVSGYDSFYEDEETENEKYRSELLQKFSKELYVDTIVSIQGSIYLELIETLSSKIAYSSVDTYDPTFYQVIEKIIENDDVTPQSSLEELERNILG